MPDRLTLSQFTTPILDIPTGIALAQALLVAMPKDAPAHVAESANDLRADADALQQAWTARSALPDPKEDPRPIDRLVDVVWASTFTRLDALASLPAALYPRAAKAAQFRDRLFVPSDRLGFVKLPYRAEWAEVKKRLDVIDKEALGPELDDLIGPEFRQEMARSFELYGHILGITSPAPAPPPSDPLLEKLRELSASIGAYTIAVLSTVKRSNPSSREVALAALRPINDTKEAARRRSSPAPEEPAAPPAKGMQEGV